MSAENPTITDAEFEEIPVIPEKVIHTIDVELTPEFLEKNPTINAIYKKGKLNLALQKNIEGEFSKMITDLIPELKSSELAIFNPFVEAINTLASYDYTVGTNKPVRPEGMDDKEYAKIVKAWITEEDVKYKEISNSIRTFNGEAGRSKTVMKAPITERAKMIDSLYSALKTFSDKRRDKVTENFKPYMDEVLAQKTAKATAAEAVANATIKTLEEKSSEATAKIEKLQGKSDYADLMTEISNYFTGAQEKVPGLNVSGLSALRTDVENHVFNLDAQGPAEQIALEKLAKGLKIGTFAIIDDAINSGNIGVAIGLPPEDSERPFMGQTYSGSANPNPIESNNVPWFNSDVTNDAENFADIIMKFNLIFGHIAAMGDFKDPMLEKFNKTFKGQIEGFRKNGKAIQDWILKKQTQYNELNK